MQAGALHWLLVAILLGTPLANAGAQTITWDGEVDSNWYNPANWDPDAYPADDANRIVSSGTPNAPIASTDVRADNGGAIAVDGLLTSASFLGDLEIGHTGAGTLAITGGGNVSDGNACIADGSASTGTVTVAGAGSTWTTSRWFAVGSKGNGTLNIADGGYVSTGPAAMIGSVSGSTGTVTVDGADSMLEISWLLCVGQCGNGTLTITGGGAVSNTDASIADRSASTGTVTVAGAGSTWTNSGDLWVGGWEAEAGGNGTVGIASGGLLEVHETLCLWPGGTLNLEAGQASVGVFDNSRGGRFAWTSGTLAFWGVLWIDSNAPFGAVGGDGITAGRALRAEQLSVGGASDGTLDIAGGGTVDSSLGYIGRSAGSHGTVTVDGNGSTWANDSGLYVGWEGTGTLDITNGGAVSNERGYIAYYADSDGTVTVDGNGPDGTSSTWTNSGKLMVGDSGSGTLTIAGGGAVSNGLGHIGRYGGSNGTVTVCDPCSTWTNTVGLYVGGSETGGGGTGQVTARDGGLVDVAGTLKLWAQGTLEIDGGQVTCGSLDNSAGGTLDFPGGTLTVSGGAFAPGAGDFVLDGPGDPALTLTGAGATMAVTGTLTVGAGNGGAGTLSIEHGGLVSSASGEMGVSPSSEGTVTVHGPGATWTNSGSLWVGGEGNGTLEIAGGGVVSNTYGDIGTWAGSSGTVTVADPCSTWTSSRDLYVGREGSGRLDIAGGGTVSNTGR